MTNLIKIIEQAFEAGWDANETITAELMAAKTTRFHFGRSYQHYLDEELRKYEDSPPMLTKDIYKEIWKVGFKAGGSLITPDPICLEEFENILKKYNLG